MATKKDDLVTEDLSFMEGMAGDGLDTFTAGTTSIAYLSMVQPDSERAGDDNPAGTWCNSATGRNYGESVKVVPLAFRTIWSEREGQSPYRTVGRYAPNSIEVEVRQPPKGQRGYPKMYNPETGNEIQELFVYAVILPDYPEDGVLYFNPTVSSMRTCKSWNSQLKGQLLPNGAQAPIFGYQWILTVGLVDNPNKKNSQISKFLRVDKDSITNKALFTEQVQPQLASVKQSVLQITSDIEQDDE